MSLPSRDRGGRILLVSPHNSYRIAPYLQAADALGIDALLASSGEHSLTRNASHGIHIDLAHPQQALERLLAEARARPFAGVIGSDDATVELASRLAARLGLPHNDPHAARLTRRKDLARARLARAGLPVPRHQCLEAEDLGSRSAIRFPCVAKPVSLSGSRGVIRVDNHHQLAAACRRIRRIAAELGDAEECALVLVEEYIPGAEVALEGLLRAGELQVLALFDKPDPLEGPYFEETYYVTPSRLTGELQARVRQRVAQACAAYGLREGPIHAELRIHQGEAWILEVASRTIGGECARLLRLGTGQSLEELVLTHALGRPLTLAGSTAGAGVLMIPIPQAGILRRVEGLSAARKVPYVEEIAISVREGYELVPLPEGASYLGFIFAVAPTVEQAEAALREAHARLHIVVAPLWKVERSLA